jgi:hypothetical protein
MRKNVSIIILAYTAGLIAGTTHYSPGPYAVPCIKAILDCRYDIARSIVDSAAAADTSDPLAPFLKLVMLGMRDVDFDTVVDSSDFFATFRRTAALIERYEQKNGISSYSRMISGLTKGALSSFYLRQGSYYAALHDGFKALDLLGESVRLDSANADPLVLLGLYDYARGELKKRLWWVMFWYPGSKERGISRLWTCHEKGLLTGTASLFALANIYFLEKKPEECKKIIALLEPGFPRSRFFLWQKINCLESQRLFYEASLACDLLAQSYAKEKYGGHNALLCLSMRAQYLVRSGQKKEAKQVCRLILNTPQNRRNKFIFKETEKLLRSLDGR